MRRTIAVTASLLLISAGFQAQGKGRASAHTQAPSHSNAPAGTPHASNDRDFGKERAEDVGRGKKVLGLYQKHSGATALREGGMSIAGVFLIQRLEGSRCGTPTLWVLKDRSTGESWGKRGWIYGGPCTTGVGDRWSAAWQ